MRLKAFVVTLILTLGFTGCLPKQEDVENVFQSNAAVIIKNDYKNIQKHLLSLKKSLDARNPKSFDKNLSYGINQLINESKSNLYLTYRGNLLEDYKEYLQIAFSKDNISNRNDYFILGLYYAVHDAYKIADGHKVIALEYDKENLLKLYKNLQIIKWKIKVDRNINNEYLFLTWQNNWQVELEKKINNKEKINYQTIQDLKYIKNGKESLLSYSNFYFEVVLTQIIDNVKGSLKSLGEEPKDLTISAVKMFLFL